MTYTCLSYIFPIKMVTKVLNIILDKPMESQIFCYEGLVHVHMLPKFELFKSFLWFRVYRVFKKTYQQLEVAYTGKTNMLRTCGSCSYVVNLQLFYRHYSDVILGAMAFQITSLTIVYSTVYSGVDQRKHQSSASLAFVRGIRRWPMNSPHKRPGTRKIFPFGDVIMYYGSVYSTHSVWLSEKKTYRHIGVAKNCSKNILMLMQVSWLRRTEWTWWSWYMFTQTSVHERVCRSAITLSINHHLII